MENLELLAKNHVNRESSIPIFLEIPKYFKDYTECILGLIKKFDLKLDGSIGREISNILGKGKSYLYFVTEDLKKEENPSKNYKKRLKSLEKKMNRFVNKEYPILRIEIFNKAFCFRKAYKIKLKQDAESNLLEIY